MQNKKAFQLAISTLIVLILGIFLLIGIAYVVTDGFSTLKSSTEPFLDTTQASSIKTACSLACNNQDKITYCCKEYEIDNLKIKCADPRLEISCPLNCQDFSCDE
jgi:hypothetical protein